jgi:hypothetical protein
VRIDRSDPADGAGDAHITRRALAAPDDPGVTGKAASGDGPPDSPLARPDSATRMAYQAKVDAVNRQYAIDHGYAGVEKPSEGGGDVPDDPRNYSNPKTGRLDASWSRYDLAMAAALEHTGGDFGPDSIKMYDYNPKTGEGTGTLIGEQTPDRLRGWRIDSQDGHLNWWDWTGGKKGAGGAYGHDWFPEDPSTPGSRYIGWAPWQDNDGNILEGN